MVKNITDLLSAGITPAKQEAVKDTIAINERKKLQDLWCTKYIKALKVPFSFSVKDKALLKQFHEEYGFEITEKAIVFLLDNYSSLSYTKGGYPSLELLVGFRRRIVPEMIETTRTKSNIKDVW